MSSHKLDEVRLSTSGAFDTLYIPEDHRDYVKKISYKDRVYELDKLDMDRKILETLKSLAKVYEVTQGGAPVHITLEIDIDVTIASSDETSAYKMIKEYFKNE